jgi:hypothetical protein
MHKACTKKDSEGVDRVMRLACSASLEAKTNGAS